MLWSWSILTRPWSSKNIIEIFWYRAQGDCFKPYKAFFNLQNKCSFLGSTKPFGWCMNICSCNSPCKKTILTSKWLMLQLHCDESAHTSLLCSTLPLGQMSPYSPNHVVVENLLQLSWLSTSPPSFQCWVQSQSNKPKRMLGDHLNVMTIMGNSAYFQIWMMRNLNQIVKFFNFMFCLVFRTFEVEFLHIHERSQLKKGL